MSTLSSARLPKGSTILITGITGYIGSWVANEALSLGYKVRGAVRDRARASWQQKFFDDKFPSRYSQVLLRSILDVPALEAAVVGVDGIIHVAVDTNLNPEPEPYISQAVEGTLNVLRVAEKEASIKSVVLTMSSVGGVFSLVNTPFAIPKDNYNEEAVKLAYDPEFKSDAKHWIVYAASKAQAEKAAWKYVEEQKPHYAISTVLPSANFGPPLSIEHQGTCSFLPPYHIY
jgi:nucleoside-diphosphate-sugar epimerase